MWGATTGLEHRSRWHQPALLAAVLGLALACPCPAAAEPATPALEHVLLLTGGAKATDPLPLVVAIHGLGDRPEAFAGLVRDLGVPARVVVPRAPDPWGKGWSWFPVRATGATPEVRLGAIVRSADRIAALVASLRAAHPTKGRAIVLGFSQGGILSFVLAVRHPDAFALAVPLSGWLPPELVPASRPPARAPPRLPAIIALHGEADTVLPVAPARASVEALKKAGWPAELRTWPSVGHSVPPPIRSTLRALVEQAARAASPEVPP